MAVLLSCGGGGGGGPGTGTGGAPGGPGVPAQAFIPPEYVGTFSSPCQAEPDFHLQETGAVMYARSHLTVFPNTGGNATIVSLQAHFYLEPTCSGSPAALLSFNSASNEVVFAGEQQAGGRTAQRVVVTLAAPMQAVRDDSTAVFGDAFRVVAPQALLSAVTYGDLWLVENGRLYEGQEPAQGELFPADVDRAVWSERVAQAPLAALPCAAQAVQWNACSATVGASVSGSTRLVADVAGSDIGSATFRCEQGAWSVTGAATCAAPPPPPPLPGACAAAPVTWTVNGLTCGATAASVPHGAERLTPNTLAGVVGSAVLACSNGAFHATLAFCDPPLPPPPVLTDPLQIAQAKNCLACHAVSNPAASIGGVSFQVIADRYRANPPAAGVLEQRVKQGSVGTFGAIPMPANPQISDAELAIVIPWILAR